MTAEINQIKNIFRLLKKLNTCPSNKNNKWATNFIENLTELITALLQRIANLTDDIMMQIIQMNPLLSLRNMVIDYCHNITGKALWMFLEQPNILSVLRCWHCKGVTEDDKYRIRDVIKDNNLVLYWEWYPYSEYEELFEAGLIPEDDDDDE